jgi:glycosyltransferase involved in cell wall biosynthesis
MKIDVVLSDKWKNKITGRAGGNTHGYTTAAQIMIRAVEKAGIEVVSGSKLCVHYTSAPFFEPEDERVNILYTMWEAQDLPTDMGRAIATADYVIVPSRSSKDVIKKAGISVPIYVCHQAVDTDFFEFRDRFCGQKVRYLWVGAPNIRKGFDLAIRAFHYAFHGTDADVELYIKSSFFKREGEITELPKNRAIVDTRNLSLEGLRELYYSAHIFFFPSRGEGAGLTPLEAMATGLSVIAPPYTGMKDYMHPALSYPVGFHLEQAHYGLDTKLCEAEQDELIEKLRYTYNHLPEALNKGRKAADFVREFFTLEEMGRRMEEILEKIVKREKLNGKDIS